MKIESDLGGTSLGVQWLRPLAPNAGGLGVIPAQGTRSHMPQLRVSMLRLKILQAATKTQYNQVNTFFFLSDLEAKGFPGGLMVKNLPVNAGDARDI